MKHEERFLIIILTLVVGCINGNNIPVAMDNHGYTSPTLLTNLMNGKDGVAIFQMLMLFYLVYLLMCVLVCSNRPCIRYIQ